MNMHDKTLHMIPLTPKMASPVLRNLENMHNIVALWRSIEKGHRRHHSDQKWVTRLEYLETYANNLIEIDQK